MDNEAAKREQRMNDPRALIFSNLLNGVPVWKVCRDFHKCESEVMHIFRFIMRKIRSKLLLDMDRPIPGETIDEIKKYRVRCLMVLPFLNLDKEPVYKDVKYEGLEFGEGGSIKNVEVLRQLTR